LTPCIMFVLWALQTPASTDESPFVTICWLQVPSGEHLQLELPIAASISRDGRVALLDRSRRILLWDSNQDYEGAFGGRGAGPGMFTFPSRLAFGPDGSIWVWDAGGRFSVFRDRAHLRDHVLPGARVRDFQPVDATRLLIAAKEIEYEAGGRRSELARFRFVILDVRDGSLREVGAHQWRESIDGRKTGYAPEADIQQGPGGKIVFGTSASDTIGVLDSRVSFEPYFEIQLPRTPPDEQDIERAREIVFHRGTRQISFADVFDFSQPKAHYTHLSIEENRISLILTPIGSLDKLYAHGWATSSGSYQHLDRATGTLLERGSYSFPEGSRIFFETGRVLICELSSDDDYRFRLARFRGPE